MNDFTGSYNWVREEAEAEAADLQYLIDNNEYTVDELQQKVIKLRQHWVTVFGTDAQGMIDIQDFSDVFNTQIAKQINFYM